MNLFRWLTALFGRSGPGAGGSAPPPAARAASKLAPFHVNGREFRQIGEWTAEAEHYVVRLSGRAGLREITMLETETPEEFSSRLLYALVDADVVFEILGGLVVPAELGDCDWREDVAKNTATHFRRSYRTEDKRQINLLILRYLQDFLTRGMGFVVSSRTASAGQVQHQRMNGTRSRTDSEVGAS